MSCNKKEANRMKADKAKHSLKKETSTRSQLLKERAKLAEALARTKTTTVTLRLPAGMNDWLDGYVHESWRTRVRKQDLVIEALCLLIARRGGVGQEVLATRLLKNAEKTDAS
jgi:hypothetical protein